MRVKSDKGTTEVHFKDFVAVMPDCEKVRAAFRAGKADKDKVHAWTAKHFGQNTYMADFDKHAGSDGPIQRLKTWDEWIAANPAQIKRYYDPIIVAQCIMGADE